MPACSESLTPSRFERRVRSGRHDLAFRVAFGTLGKAAKYFRVSFMTVWRWCHDRTALPSWVAEALADLVHQKVVEAHEAQNRLQDFRREPPKPPRPLSGCCAGYERRPKDARF